MVNIDINILKTFLEVANVRHFRKAADNLFITPAAVSARIKLLEDQLSVQLFKRERNNIQLTRQGEKLISYASNILEIWTQATQEVCAPYDYYDLSISAPKSIWSSKLSKLPNLLFESHSKLHLTIDSVGTETIITRLAERNLDFGFLYDPPKQSDIQSVPLFDIKLQIFSTHQGTTINDIKSTKFVSIDLGLSFKRILSQMIPDLHSVVFQAYDWDMAYGYLAEFGGCGLLPVDMVKDSNTELYPVIDCQMVNRTVYLCFNNRVINEEVRQEFIVELKKILM